jgi:5-methylcytosine-specific restriction endonuclease McrA
MFGTNIKFDWIPDIKFQEDGSCVYNALASLKNAPQKMKDRNMNLQFFQECENNDADMENRSSKILTFTSGVKPNWIDKLCRKYDVTHYCLDIEHKLLLKNISKSKHYSPLLYIAHDNHMYFITDKSFIQSVSHVARMNNEHNTIIKMVQENKAINNEEDKEIKCAIYDDIAVDKLDDYKDCIIIYQQSDLRNLMTEIYKRTNTLYKISTTGKKVKKIIYKNNVILQVDPNFALKHYVNKKENELLTYKHVREICKEKKIPFTNQPITSIIHKIGFKQETKELRRTLSKDEKKQILDKQVNKCNICDKAIEKMKYQFDHIIPLACDGTNDLDNMQALCIECHFEKTKGEQDNGEYYTLPQYASTFNKRCRNVVLNEFNRYAFIERFDNPAKKHKNYYIDINKCRRNIMLHLKENNMRIPVYSVLDDIKPFECGEKIDVGFYYIQSTNYLPFRYNGWYYYSAVEYALKNKLINEFNIYYSFKSSLSLEGDYFNESINEMMKLPFGLDKAGPNFLIGMMKKGALEVNKSYYTTSMRQASYRFMQTPDKDMFISKVDGTDIIEVTTSKKLESDYFTNMIYHLIVDMEAIELHKLKTLVESNKGHVTFVNTDCVECWFNNDEAIDLDKYFWDKDGKIKKYKFENKEEPPTRERMKGYKNRKEYMHNETEWNIINDPMHDNFDEIADNIINNNQSYNINGIAGSGKTTLLRLLMTKLDDQKKRYKCLAPTNKASRNLHKDALTIHKFLGCSFKNIDSLNKQLENIEYLIIDEVSMIKEVFYSIFLTIRRIKPTIKFIIAGDWRQLKPVNDRADYEYDNSRALYELCDGNKLELTKCRRSDKELFELSCKVEQVNKDQFSKVENDISICYTNATRIEKNYYCMKDISTKRKQKFLVVRKLAYDPNSQDMRIYKSLPIISRVNNKHYDIVNNETFIVHEVKKDEIVIKDDETVKTIKLDDFAKLFYPAYCITVHKSQGSTIDKPFTIYEWEKMDKRLKYTALTRGTKKNLISIV